MSQRIRIFLRGDDDEEGDAAVSFASTSPQPLPYNTENCDFIITPKSKNERLTASIIWLLKSSFCSSRDWRIAVKRSEEMENSERRDSRRASSSER